MNKSVIKRIEGLILSLTTDIKYQESIIRQKEQTILECQIIIGKYASEREGWKEILSGVGT